MVLIAGTLGAIGALGVLLAFGKMPSPAYVPVIMSIIFAGAPMVNALSVQPKRKLVLCAMAVCFGHCIGCDRWVHDHQACT